MNANEAQGGGPLSLWLKHNGYKGVSGDPRKTVEKAGPSAVASYIQNLVTSSEASKERHFHQIWRRNIYFAYGAQHIEQDSQGKWHPAELAEDERHVTNMILPKVLHELSIKVGAKPTWAVLPFDSAPEEQERARTAERLLQAIRENKSLIVQSILVELCAILTGSGIEKVYWDHSAGPVTRDIQPVMDAMGQPVIDPETGQPAMVDNGFKAMGDLVYECISPFYFHVPAGATTVDIDRMPWVAEKFPTWCSDIWRRFNYKATPEHYLTDPLATITSDFTRFMEATDISMTDYRPKDMANLIEYRERAKLIDGFETGFICWVVNNEVVDVRPDPLWTPKGDSGYPYAHHMSVPRTETFWGHARVNEMIHPQRLLNKDRMRLGQARDLGALPWLWSQLGDSIPQAAWTTGPRVLKGVTEPKYIAAPPLSQALIEDTRENMADFDRVTGLNAVAQGSLPGKSPLSGEALEYFKQAERSGMQPELFLAAWAMGKTGQLTLENIKRFMHDERLYAYAGPSGEIDSFTASANDLPERFKVIVQEDSALAQLKGPLQEKLMQAMQMGLYADVQQDPVRLHAFREFAKFPTPQGAIPPEEINRKVAAREATLLLNAGQPPQINPLQNHAVHLEHHVYRAQLDDFDRWPEQYQQVWWQHITETQQTLEQQQAVTGEAMFNQAVTQAVVGAIERGKFRDADALLLTINGIIGKFQAGQMKGAPNAQQDGEAAAGDAGGGGGPVDAGNPTVGG